MGLGCHRGSLLDESKRPQSSINQAKVTVRPATYMSVRGVNEITCVPDTVNMSHNCNTIEILEP